MTELTRTTSKLPRQQSEFHQRSTGATALATALRRPISWRPQPAANGHHPRAAFHLLLPPNPIFTVTHSARRTRTPPAKKGAFHERCCGYFHHTQMVRVARNNRLSRSGDESSEALMSPSGGRGGSEEETSLRVTRVEKDSSEGTGLDSVINVAAE